MAAKTSTTLDHRTVPRGEHHAFRHFVRMPSCRLDPPQTDGACWLYTAQATTTDHGLLAIRHPKLTPTREWRAHGHIEHHCGNPSVQIILRSSSAPSRNLGSRLLLRASSEQKMTWSLHHFPRLSGSSCTFPVSEVQPKSTYRVSFSNSFCASFESGKQVPVSEQSHPGRLHFDSSAM